MKSVLFVSHGSYSPKAKQEAETLVAQLKDQVQIPIMEVAFLEIERPDINRGIDLCVQQGATEVLVLLNFLNSGRHVQKDIPQIVKESQDKYPHVKIKISVPIGQHPKIKDLFIDLISLA